MSRSGPPPLACALSCLVAFAALGPTRAAAQPAPGITLKLLASGLTAPLTARHARDGSGRLFIVEQPGRIRIYDGTTVLPTPFLDITDRVAYGGEEGLLGLDFHPDYADNGTFYVCYTRQADFKLVVSRFSVTNDPDMADPDTEVEILTIPLKWGVHNGGDIHFGPDGYLYLGIGEGGAPIYDSQDLDSLFGKMLRIDVDPYGTYTIPPDNPYVGVAGLDEIWAHGLRNPWRWSFDRSTGDLLIGDVGEMQREEVDFQQQSSSGGENYGWSCFEGDLPYDPTGPGCGGPYVAPILVYDHTQGCSVTGGYRYRGSSVLAGSYLYADYCLGTIWFASPDADGVWSSQLLKNTPENIVGFGEDEAGELYVLTLNGSLYGIEADPVDLGDAPGSYPTLRAQNGAGHAVSNLVLGSRVDSEPDGQPSIHADGDDVSPQGSPDDEDGVVTVGDWLPGNAVSVSVRASTQGFVDAWVDFNQDGDWSDGDEQIFASTPVSSGLNLLPLTIPSTALIGATTARFRISSAGGLSFDGLAPDGEVEDHEIYIATLASVDDVTVVEGDSGVTRAEFTVTLSSPSAATVEVLCDADNDTATSPSDFFRPAPSIFFPPGSTSRTLVVWVVGDRIAEPDESFFLHLSPGAGTEIADGEGVGTILNDDIPGTLQFSDPTYVAGESGGFASITVTRTGGNAGGVTVDYSTADGTAIAGLDYAATSGTLSFGVDVLSQTFVIPINSDTLDDDAETVLLTLSNPTAGAVLGLSNATLTIADDDVAGQLAFSLVSFSVGEAGKNAVISVVRSGGAASGVSVAYSTSDGSATAGTDYAATSGTLTFAANVSKLSFTVPITNDTLAEGIETLLLELSSPGGGGVLGAPRAALLAITDNDAGGAFRLGKSSYTVSEGLASLKVSVTRPGGVASGVTVDYATSDGTAQEPGDYTAVGGTLTFAAGQASQTLTIPIAADALDEVNESFALALTNPTGGATLGSPAAATITVTDNDAGGVLQFSLTGVSVDEGAGSAGVVVSRAGGSAEGVSVTCTPTDGSAQGGADHGGSAQVLSFGAGVMSQSCTVPILEDALAEGSETLSLTLSDPAGGAGLGAKQTATLTITDNEPITTLHLAAASFSAKEGALGTVTVKRSGPALDPVTVDFVTSDGTALLADSDYTVSSGTLSFAANVTSLTFTVATGADARDEVDEDVNLTLSNPTGGAMLGTQATGKLLIVDNDGGGALRFSAANFNRTEGAATATVTVTRTGGTASGVTVDYATSDGTAQEPGDYTASTGTLTFAAGQVTRTIGIPIVRDAADEANETLNLALSNPTGGATLGAPATATLTITDDDAGGVLQFSLTGVSVDEGAGTAAVVVKRTGGAADSVSVTCTPTDGSAGVGSDHDGAAQVLSFAAGVLSQICTIPILEDVLAEGSEALTLTLSDPVGGASLGVKHTATLTITDNEPVTTLHLAAALFGATEGGRGLVTVKRSGPALDPVTVDFATADGTALLADSDYKAASGTLSFGANVTSLTFLVSTTADTRDEPDEDVNLTLSNPTGGAVLGTQTTGQLLIADNDAGGAFHFSAANYSRLENSVTAIVTVTRTGGTASGVTVDYATSDGTAQEPGDYLASAGTLSFAAGQKSKTFTIGIAEDALDEANETIDLTLSNPTGGATIDAPAATLTIVDNDLAGSVALSAALFSVGESDGTVTITVTRSGGGAGGVTVAYATSDGTALAGTDYQAASGTLQFEAGETCKTFVVSITPDVLAEANETLLLALSAPGGGALLGSPGTATLFIVDDD
jgi:hypothetical protein